jgi:hypothetical protein
MAIVERHGLPLSVSTHAANHHEVRLVQLCFDFYVIEAKPENLIGDRAYDRSCRAQAARLTSQASLVGASQPGFRAQESVDIHCIPGGFQRCRSCGS